MVVDTAGLRSLVADLVTEEFYGFDTEFHTEKTYVPDLALIQIAWADKVALVDPLAVDPAPLAEVFGGPGTAVVHAASQDLDVLMAACGTVPATVFDTQIVAGFLGMSSPSLSRLVDQMLGVSLPKADRLSDWLERPISDRQVSYAVNDVAHLLELRLVLTERLRALGRLDWALDECDQVLGDRAAGPRARGGVVEARRHPRHVAPKPRRRPGGGGLAGAHRRGDEPPPAHDPVGPRPDGDLAAPASQRRRAAPARGVDGRHLAQGRAAEILAAVNRGLGLQPDQIRMPTEGRDAVAPAAAVAVCSGVVRQIADDLDFDQGLLATRADIAQLLAAEPSRLDTGWRRTIVGDPLRRLIDGDVAAAFDRRGHLVIEERSRRPVPPTGGHSSAGG